MCNRFKAALTAVLIFTVNTASVFAVDSVDFSEKLSVLRTLMRECYEKGIPIDYESVNFATIERFEKYINEDIANGFEYTGYTLDAIEDLYTEAKTNLESYLSGEKEAFEIKRPDMTNLRISSGLIYDGNTPVFSIGYGHFARAKEDISSFPNFGANNVAMEIGPVHTVSSTYGWNISKVGEVTAIAERSGAEKYNGEYSLKIQNDKAYESGGVYLTLYRKIKCTPGAKYKFGCMSKGTASRLWISLDGFNDRSSVGTSYNWTENVYYYTARENQTEFEFRINSDDLCSVYLDDFFIYEVNENNEVISGNLVSNPGVEAEYTEFDVSDKLEEVKKYLSVAKVNNVAVSLLLSPHYFPENLSSDIYGEQDNFLGFNINHPVAIDIVEKHIRRVMSEVGDYPALNNIILSNEPQFKTTWYYDYYNPLFREYLENVHGSIENLNDAYESNYTSFSEINMPTDLTEADELCYDWMEFNDRTFAQWHEWMAGIVKEYTKKPVSIKALRNFWQNETEDRMYLDQGVDYELFGEFSDYAGHDGSNIYDKNTWFANYHVSMFSYDFFQSLIGKPPYNSEEHIIRDGNENFSREHTKYVTNHMWQAAVHGRAMSTIWVWDRSYDKTGSFWGSILFRPDAVAGVGKVSLDTMRLSDEIAELQINSPKVGIYYSKPSRLYDGTHFSKLQEAYRELVNCGLDTVVISDRNLDNLSETDTLIIPHAVNCREETLNAIEDFIRNGGTVYYTVHRGTSPELSLGSDEYNNPLDNSYFLENAFYRTTVADKLVDTGKAEITLRDEKTGMYPENLDWQYSIVKGKLILDITSLDYGTAKNISVYYDGEKVSGMTEIISNTEDVETVTLNGFEPQLLTCRLYDITPAEISDLSFDRDSRKICWEAKSDNYAGAEVYTYNNDRTLSFVTKVHGTEYYCPENGTYVIHAVNKDGIKSESKTITVSTEKVAEISVSEFKDGYCMVSTQNLTDDYIYGAISVEYLDSEGKTIAYGYGKTLIGPLKTNITKVSVPVPENALYVRVAMYDSIYKKNVVYSDEEIFEIEKGGN